MTDAPSRRPTRQRILEGVREALSRHGFAKLGMQDVAEAAGVSRATLYRYFPNLETLLSEFTSQEAERFRQHVLEAARAVPEPASRLRLVLEYATRHIHEDPVLRRFIRSDPARVLTGVRAQYPQIRAQLDELLRPLLEESPVVRAGRVAVEPLLDAFVRVLVSTYLYPGPEPADLKATLEALYALVSGPAPAALPSPRRKKKEDR